jgi:hypothetical protein
MYFDRNGQPMTEEEWARAFEDIEMRRVLETALHDGKRISTVWLGLDHGLGARPLIFETMVFEGEHSLDCERYATEAEARAGHEAMVATWQPRH